ncbi:MAG: hypothetical protein HPY54_00300 [Chthonomonadetes bacterium]|nr:hypothetical protein [Chthonomonadetes bacterium]
MRFGEELVHEEIYRLLTREYSQASCVSLAVLLAAAGGAVLGGWISTFSPGTAEPGAVIVITMGVSALIAYAYTVARRKPELSTDDIRRVLPLLNLDEGEQAYVDSLLAIGDNPYLSDETAVQIVTEMRRLLNTYYQVQNHLEQLREAMGTASEEEREKLRQRLEQAQDAEARSALQESLQLLEGRLKSRQTLSTYAQRMEAHLELILQTLKSLRDSLARLKIAPEGPGEFDIEHLRQRLLEIQQETSAIESAVQEVLGGAL